MSRQPHSVRAPNQVQEGDNALFSVVSGGFEKRPASQLIAQVTGLDTTLEYAAFPIDRDSTEQLFVLLDGNGNIQVYDTIAGTAKTVTIGDSTRYFLVEAIQCDSTGVMDTSALVKAQGDGWDSSDRYQIKHADTQFDWSWEMSDSSMQWDLQGSANGSTWNDIKSNVTGATSGSFSTTVDAVATGDHNYIRINIDTAAGSAADTLTLKATFKDKTYLFQGIAGPEDFAFVSVADYNFIVNRTVTARMAEAQGGTLTGTKQVFSDLPAASGSGNYWKVEGNAADGFTQYYVKDTETGTTDTWQESEDPTGYNDFDLTSLPHQLVREADGTFTFKAASYNSRAVGDDTLVPPPSFVGKTINDAVFFRNRLGFIADENVYLSRSAAPLNMWPGKAVDVLDTDPIDRAATTTDVNILHWGAVFRKILFATSVRAQFEMTSDASFTPSAAEFDQSTRYPASTLCKPRTMGDVLYFASAGFDHGVVFEYFLEENTFANAAADISKHVEEYIPTDILQIATDPSSGTAFVLSSGEQNAVFVYKSFFDGTQKVQSSWAKWTLGATEAKALIHGIGVFSGFLVMLVERFDGNFYLEQVPVSTEAFDADMGFIPLLDQRETATGTYDSTNDVTYWDPTWEHEDDAEVVLGPGFTGDDIGRRMTVIFPDQYTLTLASVAAGETFILDDGTTSQTYTAHALTTDTTAREFSISGNDTADAGELVTCINDATDGHPTISATDNGDGTITLNVDDAADGSIVAPTGTAITNATITAAAFGQRIAARGRHDDAAAYLGRTYEMNVELSKLYLRESPDSPSVINGRLQIRDITFQYVNTGYFKVVVTPRLRSANTHIFAGRVIGDDDNVVGAAAIADTGNFRAMVNTNGETGKIEIKNDTPYPSTITSAAWRAFFNELSRQA